MHTWRGVPVPHNPALGSLLNSLTGERMKDNLDDTTQLQKGELKSKKQEKVLP